MKDNMAWVRLIVLIIMIINTYLTAKGWNPIPYSEEEIYEAVSAIALGITTLWAWWKNNNVTKEAKQAQIQLDKLKNKKHIV